MAGVTKFDKACVPRVAGNLSADSIGAGQLCEAGVSSCGMASSTRISPLVTVGAVLGLGFLGWKLVDANSEASLTEGPATEALTEGTAEGTADGAAEATAGAAAKSDPPSPAPLYGGQVTLHTFGFSSSLNGAIDNSNTTQVIQLEIHDTLLTRDWETTRFGPSLARAWHEEDLVVLNADAPLVEGEVEVQVTRSDDDRTLVPRRAVYGSVSRGEAAISVRPASPGADLKGEVLIPLASVDRIDEATVITFELREGVRWQPSLVYEGEDLERTKGQELDANDVHFSWSIHQNPEVSCGAKRSSFETIPGCRVVDGRTVRFFGAEQSAFTLQSVADVLTVLPSHIYNLSDPDCPEFNEAAGQSERAAHINVNGHNRLWVGLGPYQVVEHGQDSVLARRFVDASGEPAYFDAESRPGYFDSIRWRAIAGGQQALMALLNGEVDFMQRLTPDDYFGESTQSDSFNASFIKDRFFLGDYSYVTWNMHSPKLSDLAVRKAIAHAFDMEGYLQNQNRGLGRIKTGPLQEGFNGYPEDAQHFSHDIDLARQILEDAGWYDHNGNGVADKDGVELKIELLFPAGSGTFKALSRSLQDAVLSLGIDLQITSLEFPTMMERIHERRFEAAGLAWFPALESDPAALWHSKEGALDVTGSSNFSGVMDEELDGLIEAIQRETDEPSRMELWKRFHRRVYEDIQPYLFCLNVPVTYAASNKIRGIEHAPMAPGYVLRSWHYTDPSIPGVRTTLSLGD